MFISIAGWVLRCYGQMIECALVDYTTINWLVKQQNINIMFFCQEVNYLVNSNLVMKIDKILLTRTFM